MKIVSVVILFFGIAGYGLCGEKSSHEFIYADQNFEDFKLVARKTKLVDECHDVTKYKKKATWIPAKEECKTVPGKKVCANIFGVKICGKEAAKNVCKTIPAHKEFKKVPYVVNVCEPVKKLQRRFEAFVNVNFKETRLKPQVKMNFLLKKNGKIAATIEDLSKKPVVLVSKGEREVIKEGKKTYIYKTMNITTLNQAKLLSPVSEKPNTLRFANNGIHFMVNKVFFPKKTAVKLMIKNTRNEKILIDQMIARDLYHIEKLEDNKSRIILNLNRLGLNLRNKEYQVKVVVLVDVDGNILNKDLPKLRTQKVRKMVYKF